MSRLDEVKESCGQVKRRSDRGCLTSISPEALQIHCRAHGLWLEGNTNLQGYRVTQQNVAVSGGTCVSIITL